jgi:hypothetical protein
VAPADPTDLPRSGGLLDQGTANKKDPREPRVLLADVADLYSNPLELPFTPVELQKLAVPGDRSGGLNEPKVYRSHELSKRLGGAKVEELVRRAQAGESGRSLARELGVANSALTRMLREQGVEISKRKVSDEESTAMAAEYESGATMVELEKKYGLSHGAVLRSLHRSAVSMRASAPRRRQG